MATEISGAGDADTLGDATAYTDGREDAIRDDMATGDTNTLNQANEYTDIAIQQLIGFDASELEGRVRSEEHTSELQSLMRNSYAVFCLKNKITNNNIPIE